MGEIQRFDKPPQRVKIVGAADIEQTRTQILDNKTPQAQPPAEVRVHGETITEETITEDEKLRRVKRRPEEPQVRIRNFDLKDWERVKRGED